MIVVKQRRGERTENTDMITQEMIDRINELARKAKGPEGLTPEEAEEQQTLRRAYIDAFKANLRSQLDQITLVDPPSNKRS